MNTKPSTFSQRLASARKMAGLSLQELSEKIDNYVTRQALQRYEKDEMSPGYDVLKHLADALDVAVDFFYIEQNIVFEGIDYRKRSSQLTKTEAASIEEKVKDKLSRIFSLEFELNIQNPSHYFNYTKEILTEDDAEEAAQILREEWNLGYDPIPDVVKMLEDMGFYVLDIEAPQSFDGLKTISNGKRIIALRKADSGSDVVRRRFTALHELAHHSLQFAPSLTEKEYEKLCHTFACAVLYPKQKAETELSKNRFHFYENELILIKRRWGISFSAVFSRAFRLGIITPAVYKRFNIGYRKRGFHIKEPGEYCADEQPNRFEMLVYHALASEAISMTDAAYYMNMPVDKFREELKALM